MIKILVKLLINFPKFGELFFKVVEAYEKEVYKRQHNANDDLIDEWMFTPKPFSSSDEDSLLYLETESPFVHNERKGDNRRDFEVRE
jgi:hypothetical protein